MPSWLKIGKILTMISFLHNYSPSPIFFNLGPITLRWYGLLIALGAMIAFLIALRLAKHYQLKKDLVFDLTFWLILAGILGARIYDVLLELPYYLKYPEKFFFVWEGGLAIHGAILAGLIVVYLFSKKHKINFWILSALTVTVLPLAQAVGRFGNYFNQELFGKPTNLAWGIPIDASYRPLNFLEFTHFHPTFLYESLGLILIFLSLLFFTYYFLVKQKVYPNFYKHLTIIYLIAYSVLRFSLEFIRLDETSLFLGLRWPQVISLIIIIISLFIIFKTHVLVQIKRKG